MTRISAIVEMSDDAEAIARRREIRRRKVLERASERLQKLGHFVEDAEFEPPSVNVLERNETVVTDGGIASVIGPEVDTVDVFGHQKIDQKSVDVLLKKSLNQNWYICAIAIVMSIAFKVCESNGLTMYPTVVFTTLLVIKSSFKIYHGGQEPDERNVLKTQLSLLGLKTEKIMLAIQCALSTKAFIENVAIYLFVLLLINSL